MKLATAKDGSRDGQLLVVSRDLSLAHYATGIANTLQQVLDDWSFLSSQLQDLSDSLNQGKARHAFAFDPARCMAPLPRAYQWAEGSAYLNHAALLDGQAQSVPAFPLMHQGASDEFLGPCDDIRVSSEELGTDFAAELAVITGDLGMGCSPEHALDGVRLVMLANAVSLRQGGQSQAAPAFSPVAVTVDELGGAWQQGRLHLALQSSWNGRKVGMCEAGPEMNFHFGQLIAQLCKGRNVRAGSIIGSGAVSNQGLDDQGRMSWPRGYSCIAEKRAMETLQDGQPSTPFMKFGDSIRIEMKDKDGHSIFGAIDQKVVSAQLA